MELIREKIIEKIAQIGAGESLLIFTTNQDTFIKFDAKTNGQIQMTADNGNVEVLMTRDNIAQVVDDFSVVEQIKELPLKTIKLNADGQFQVDDEPDTFLKSIDGIADRSMIPLEQQVKAALLNILPSMSSGLAEDIRGDVSTFTYELENGFTIDVGCNEKLNQICISFRTPVVDGKQIDAHQNAYHEKPLPFMVRAAYGENPYLGYWVTFRVDLPAIPFIAQHLAFALNNLGDAMKDWTENYGG